MKKTILFFLFSATLPFLQISCAPKAQKTLADYYEDHPGQTEYTATRHVKARTVRDNRNRVKYYNSIQHR